jgi:alpha-amylase/alpha-mannosidase (GH57 family)
MTANRYVCIHGHFYQPPRENPWLEAIEQQESAHPYRDWNHRITAECYGPNAAARILDEEEWIVNIVNNYTRLSFNVGPTLLSWMETEVPRVYRRIIEADAASAALFGGHGSAMAQVYNHIIMPLASARDKHTQVRWGIRDFERRFGRAPRGMWLAETAADTESLSVLAEHGIEFTILAPNQCARVRDLEASGKASEWKSVGDRVDTTRPYWVSLPGGRRIAVFFYDGPTARAVAFERLLHRGEVFAERLASGFKSEDRPQLAHIATDGETYGHHHRHGEMALAYAFHHLDRSGLAQITNYSQFLEIAPPTWEAEIVEDSSWSCFHGVERWRADCGCHTGGQASWNQAWRRPLRESLDWLAARLAEIYERCCPLADPWAARDDYIEVVLDRSDASLAAFLERHGAAGLEGDRLVQLLSLMEMQRHAMLMFTSCGWFFDELSGIETVQIIQYAGRAIQLALPYDPGLEEGFLALLGQAKSNLPQKRDGAKIYIQAVRPAAVDLAKVVAHYAVSSLFEDYGDQTVVHGFDVRRLDYLRRSDGKRKLVIGRVDCRSRITRDTATLSFAALHLGDHNLSGGVRGTRGPEHYTEMRDIVAETFRSGDIAQVMRLLDSYFLEMTYSLKSLFRDEQRRVLLHLLDGALEDAAAVSARMHKEHAALIRYVVGLNVPLPRTVRSAADFMLNTNLREALEAELPDPTEIRSMLSEARELRVSLDEEELAEALRLSLERLADRFAAAPLEAGPLGELARAAGLIPDLPFEVELFQVQNAVFRVAKELRPELMTLSETGDGPASDWVAQLLQVTEALHIRL